MAARKARTRDSHLFKVHLANTKLTDKQVQRVAAAIRNTALNELLAVDFRIEDLAKIIRGPGLPEAASCKGCGNACSM